jgi:hypothetical protein
MSLRTTSPVVFLAALALAPAAAHAQARPAAAAATAISSWQEAGNAQTLANRTFAFTRQEVGGRDVRMLLVQEVRATVRDDREGVDGRVRVTAYERGGRGYGRALWTIDQAGDGAGFEANDLYWVNLPACCATLPTRRYFSLRTGRPLFSATSGVQQLAGEPFRRVAFLSASGAAQLPAFRGARDVIGALQLVEGETVRQTLLFRSTDPLLEMESPEVGVAIRAVRGRAENTVWVRFSDGREARIPVDARGFALAQAQLPAGVTVR